MDKNDCVKKTIRSKETNTGFKKIYKSTIAVDYDQFTRGVDLFGQKCTICQHVANDIIPQWFPNFFVCRHRKLVELILRHTGDANLFQLMSSGITGDSENGDDLFFWRSPLVWAKIFGNHLMQPQMMLSTKKKSLSLWP